MVTRETPATFAAAVIERKDDKRSQSFHVRSLTPLRLVLPPMPALILPYWRYSNMSRAG